MTEVLHSPSSSSSPSISTPTHNAASLFQQTQSFGDNDDMVSNLTGYESEEEENSTSVLEKREKDRRDQLSLLAILFTLFRKSFWVACKTDRDGLSRAAETGAVCGSRSGSRSGVMEIGWPTDVEHVNHVTFDRFDGFLGLPVEFEPEVPRRAPSASTTVFGVSTESMQLSYDLRGNSIPTILLLMQRHLYLLGGLQAEGIFRLTAGNSQEEYVRDQLNRGVVPQGVDVHCLAGLIKAWFRELPRGVLDSLSPEQVIQCQSEEECVALIRLLPQTEAALLNWAINLMADVVEEERFNKMNARNIAMVFAPNMTQMADPLTALMYAVQVMNFLKTLIEKTLRDREDSLIDPVAPIPWTKPSDDNGNQSSSLLDEENPADSNEKTTPSFVAEDPVSESGSENNPVDSASDEEYVSYPTSPEESEASVSCETPVHVCVVKVIKACRGGQSIHDVKPDYQVAPKIDDKSRGISNLSRINSMTERFEAWR